MFASIKRTLRHAMSLLCLGVLAFNASAAEIQQKGTHLRIQFDKDIEDTISIQGIGLNDVVVQVNADPPMPFTNVLNISIKGSDQTDTLYVVGNVEIQGTLKVKTGAGDDSIFISGAFAKNLKVNLGDGDDVHWDNGGAIVVGGNYTIKCGKGDDDTDIWGGMFVYGNMSIDHGPGPGPGEVNDSLGLHIGVKTILKKLSIKLAKNTEHWAYLEGVTAPKLMVRGGKGHNTVDLSDDGNSFVKTKITKVEDLIL